MTFSEVAIAGEFTTDGGTFRKCSVNKAHRIKDKKDGEGPHRFRAETEVAVAEVAPSPVVEVAPAKPHKSK